MLSFLNKSFEKKIPSHGLSLFRILFSLNLLFEVVWIFRHKELYFDQIPFIDQTSFNYSIILSIWILVLVLLILGFYTRIMAILSYLIGLVVFSFTILAYHMYFVYSGIGFLMIFMPISNSLSLDALFFRNKSQVKTIPQFYYFFTVFVGLSLVYFDSVFFKLSSQTWMNGLGLWLPSSLPFMAINNQEWLLNNEFLVKFFGYLTFAFEVVFPFTFFLKKWRIPLLLIGVLLHFGISIQFPIPYFGYGAIAIYVLMIPSRFWEHLFKKKFSSTKCTNSNIGVNNMINYKSIRLWKIFVVIIILLQINATIGNQIKKLGFSTIHSFSNAVEKGSAKFFGITEHGVFIDQHFRGYTKLYTISFNDKLLPLFNEFGMADQYLLSGSWVNFCFGVNRPNVFKYKKSLKNGLIRYTAYWAYKNNVSLENAKFKILQRDINVKFEWEANLLQNNLDKTWSEAGVLIWENSEATIEINDL